MGFDMVHLLARRLAKHEEWLRMGMGSWELKNKEMISEREGSAAGLALRFPHANNNIPQERSVRRYRSLRRQNDFN